MLALLGLLLLIGCCGAFPDLTRAHHLGTGDASRHTSTSHVPRTATARGTHARRPHLLFHLLDDLGTYDASFRMAELGREPDILTPNIDAMAHGGTLATNYYVQMSCSPSRASLLTGRYSANTGLGNTLIGVDDRSCLPQSLPLLPQALQELGYATHMIGKWHLGLYNDSCVPWKRGFDTFLGFLGGELDYYNHTATGGGVFIDDFVGSDWFLCLDGMEDACRSCSDSHRGEYTTEVFAKRAQSLIRGWTAGDAPLFIYLAWQAPHVPLLEPPERYLAPYAHIADVKRRTYAGMVAALDEAIGSVSSALVQSGIANESIIVLSSDNGAASGGSGGLNYPYRGYKNTLWEGGIRAIGLVYSPLLGHAPLLSTSLLTDAAPLRRYDGILWIGDWYATLVSAALALEPSSSLGSTRARIAPLLEGGAVDSIDHWAALGAASRGISIDPPRSELLISGFEVEGVTLNFSSVSSPEALAFWEMALSPMETAAIRVGRHKLVVGTPIAATHCDMNVSGASPAYPAPSLGDAESGEGGIYCMMLAPQTPCDGRDFNESVSWRSCVAGLFDLEADPREIHDLQWEMPDLAAELYARLNSFAPTAAPNAHGQLDIASDIQGQASGCWAPWG